MTTSRMKIRYIFACEQQKFFLAYSSNHAVDERARIPIMRMPHGLQFYFASFTENKREIHSTNSSIQHRKKERKKDDWRKPLQAELNMFRERFIFGFISISPEVNIKDLLTCLFTVPIGLLGEFDDKSRQNLPLCSIHIFS